MSQVVVEVDEPRYNNVTLDLEVEEDTVEEGPCPCWTPKRSLFGFGN